MADVAKNKKHFLLYFLLFWLLGCWVDFWIIFYGLLVDLGVENQRKNIKNKCKKWWKRCCDFGWFFVLFCTHRGAALMPKNFSWGSRRDIKYVTLLSNSLVLCLQNLSCQRLVNVGMKTNTRLHFMLAYFHSVRHRVSDSALAESILHQVCLI